MTEGERKANKETESYKNVKNLRYKERGERDKIYTEIKDQY
jgi:hypothetical protein